MSLQDHGEPDDRGEYPSKENWWCAFRGVYEMLECFFSVLYKLLLAEVLTEGILWEATLDLNNIYLSGLSFDSNSSFPPVLIPW